MSEDTIFATVKNTGDRAVVVHTVGGPVVVQPGAESAELEFTPAEHKQNSKSYETTEAGSKKSKKDKDDDGKPSGLPGGLPGAA